MYPLYVDSNWGGVCSVGCRAPLGGAGAGRGRLNGTLPHWECQGHTAISIGAVCLIGGSAGSAASPLPAASSARLLPGSLARAPGAAGPAVANEGTAEPVLPSADAVAASPKRR